MVILVALAVAPRVRVSKDPMENCTVLIATKNLRQMALGVIQPVDTSLRISTQHLSPVE